MDEEKIKQVGLILQKMPEGAEITLKDLNTVIMCVRMWDLYEIVQHHMRQNMEYFSFLKGDPLEKSTILRKVTTDIWRI